MNWATIILIILFTYSLAVSIIERVKLKMGLQSIVTITLSYLILGWLIYLAIN